MSALSSARREWLPAAALLFLSLSPVAMQAAEFGRFFTTAEQRAALDRSRGKAAAAPRAPAAVQAAPEPALRDNGLALDGLVYSDKRKQGTAWINGVRADAVGDGRSATARVVGDSVTVILPGGGREYHLKVGQKLAPDSGRVSDLPLADAAPTAARDETNTTAHDQRERRRVP